MFRMVALMMMAVFVSSAAVAAPSLQQRTFGEWHGDAQPGYQNAHAINSAGSEFGFTCTGISSCTFYVDLRRDCVKGRIYPALISTPAGGTTIEAFCLKLGDRSMFAFDHPQLYDILGESEFAFGLPIEDSQFNISKFSLSGAKDAVAWVKDQAGRDAGSAHGGH